MKSKKNKETDPVCFRQQKITSSSTDNNDMNNDNFNVIINFEVLKQFVLNVALCTECNSTKLLFQDQPKFRMGLANRFSLGCCSCKWSTQFFTSKECTNTKDKKGHNIF